MMLGYYCVLQNLMYSGTPLCGLQLYRHPLKMQSVLENLRQNVRNKRKVKAKYRFVKVHHSVLSVQ